MAKSKRFGHAYLNDFKKDENGNYVYRGRQYSFDGDESARRRYLTVLGCEVAAAAILTFAQECLPGTMLNRTYFASIPWAFQMIAVCTVIWAYSKLLAGKEPLREYVYEVTVKKLPHRTLLSAIFALLCAVSETVYIVITGLGDAVLFTVLRPSMSLINGAVCFLMYLKTRKEHWSLIKKPSEEEAKNS